MIGVPISRVRRTGLDEPALKLVYIMLEDGLHPWQRLESWKAWTLSFGIYGLQRQA